jgi:hypothetical protein
MNDKNGKKREHDKTRVQGQKDGKCQKRQHDKKPAADRRSCEDDNTCEDDSQLPIPGPAEVRPRCSDYGYCVNEEYDTDDEDQTHPYICHDCSLCWL